MRGLEKGECGATLWGSMLTLQPQEPVLLREPKNAKGTEAPTAPQAGAAWLLPVQSPLLHSVTA